MDTKLSDYQIEYALEHVSLGHICTIFIHETGINTSFEIGSLVELINHIDKKHQTLCGHDAKSDFQELHDLNVWWFMQSLKGELSANECLKMIDGRIKTISAKYEINVMEDSNGIPQRQN